MNRKAETIPFIIITLTALIVIGALIITFTGKSPLTGNAVKTGECYTLTYGTLKAADISVCCAGIKASDRCFAYNSELTRCSGTTDVVMSKETIQSCEQ